MRGANHEGNAQYEAAVALEKRVPVPKIHFLTQAAMAEFELADVCARRSRSCRVYRVNPAELNFSSRFYAKIEFIRRV